MQRAGGADAVAHGREGEGWRLCMGAIAGDAARGDPVSNLVGRSRAEGAPDRLACVGSCKGAAGGAAAAVEGPARKVVLAGKPKHPRMHALCMRNSSRVVAVLWHLQRVVHASSYASHRELYDSPTWPLLSKPPVLPHTTTVLLTVQDTSRYSPMTFNEANFLRSFCVVLAHAVFLPSAECFALLPIASLLGRTGNGNGCDLDYDAERSSVVVRASVSHK